MITFFFLINKWHHEKGTLVRYFERNYGFLLKKKRVKERLFGFEEEEQGRVQGGWTEVDREVVRPARIENG